MPVSRTASVPGVRRSGQETQVPHLSASLPKKRPRQLVVQRCGAGHLLFLVLYDIILYGNIFGRRLPGGERLMSERMMKDTEARTAGLELMATTAAVFLTIIDENGYPHTRAMLNLRNRRHYPKQVHLYEPHGDDFMVYFTTNTPSKKVAQMRINPKVCVYYCDPTPGQRHGLMLAGDIEIVDDSGIRHALWTDGWEMFYPGGPDDPDHTVCRLYPVYATSWYRGRRFEFSIGDS